MATADPLAAPRPGEISPFVVNLGTIEAAMERLRNLPSPRGQLRASGDEINQRLPVPHSSVLVRNDTGSAAPALSILKLGDTLQTITTRPHDIFRLPSFEGTTPDSASNPFGVLLVGAASGTIAEAAIRGEAVCYVDIVDTAHEWAAPSAGINTHLVSGDSGPARILSRATGTTGRQLCCVLIDDRGDRQVREVVDESEENSEPATEETLYSDDEPTTSTPAFQQFIADNYTGGGGGNLPGGFQAIYPEGTANDAAYFLEATTATVTQSVTLNSTTTSFEWTESGGDITLAFTNIELLDFTGVTELDLTGVTVTGFSGSGGRSEESLAATGTDQAGAAQITADAVAVTGSNNVNGVKLPNTEAAVVVVWNSDTTNSVFVYPPSGGELGPLGTNNPQTLEAEDVLIFTRITSTQWSYVELANTAGA